MIYPYEYDYDDDRILKYAWIVYVCYWLHWLLGLWVFYSGFCELNKLKGVLDKLWIFRA